MRNFFAALIVAISLTGCGIVGQRFQMEEVEVEKVFTQRLTEDERAVVEIPFIIPDSIVIRLKEMTAGLSASAKMEVIMDYLFREGAVNLRYQEGETYSARETLQKRQGNCISLSHLLIGITRKLGMNSHYVYMLRNPQISINNHLISINYHVLVAVDVEGDLKYYDFSPGRKDVFLSIYGVDDLEGIGLHYNNLGANALADGNKSLANNYFAIARKLAPENPEILSNVGLYFIRNQEIDSAQYYLKKAIEVDENCYPAWHNLLFTHLFKGDIEEYQRVKNQLTELNTPLFSLFLGNMAYQEGRYREALKHLDKVDENIKNIYVIYLLRAQCYYHLKEYRSAMKWLEKYEEFEDDNAHAIILRSRLEELIPSKFP